MFPHHPLLSRTTHRIGPWLVLCLSLLVFPHLSQAQSDFRETAPLVAGRNSHTATLLANGDVLIVGGRNAKHEAIASVEIYHPATETVTQASPLKTARFDHHATLLPNRKVLVTGGAATAELYDPATGGWATTGPADARAGNDSATLLSTGKVLVTGGLDLAGKGISHLYDPAADTWTTTGSLARARKKSTATLLNDGTVLVCGGEDYLTQAPTDTAEIYSPASGIWTTTGVLATPRQNHTATPLPDGQVLVCGGRNRDPLSSAEIFNPSTGRWSVARPLSVEREFHTAVTLPDGKILVIGGVPSASTVLGTTEIYDPVSGNWQKSPDLITSRGLHTAVNMEFDQILITGGWGSYNKPTPGDFNLTLGSNEIFGTAPPRLVVESDGKTLTSGDATPFGNVIPGEKTTRSFTLRNTGATAIAGLAISLGNPSDFTATPPTVSTTLAPGTTITFTISFSPKALGNSSATLSISSTNLYSNSFTQLLTGTGALSPASGTVERDGQTLPPGEGTSFGNIMAGEKTTRSFTLRNTGTVPLTGLAISLGNSTDFTATPSTIPTTLAPGATTTFSIGFSPKAQGNSTATLSISAPNLYSTPFVHLLTGTGTVPDLPSATVEMDGTIIATGAGTSFGNIIPGETATRSFTLRNTGKTALTGLAISLGTSTAFTAAPSSIPTTLAPGATATFSIIFSPKTLVTSTATLSISGTNLYIPPFTHSLSGTGALPEIVVEQPAGTSLKDGAATKNFGAIKVGKKSSALTFTIKNIGKAGLNGIVIYKNGLHRSDFSISILNKTVLTTGTSMTFRVTFSPQGAGTRTAALSIQSNDADENPFDIVLTGKGTK